MDLIRLLVIITIVILGKIAMISIFLISTFDLSKEDKRKLVNIIFLFFVISIPLALIQTIYYIYYGLGLFAIWVSQL
jgi:hypothetical protein